MNNALKKQPLHLIGGRTHPDLTAELAKLLKIKPCKVLLNNFANGEISCQIGETIRGNDVFVLQTHSTNVNDAIMEQAIIIDACKRASAASITAVCPFMGYARQDRKSSGREPVTARLIVDILAHAGADRIMSIDLHAGQIQGFFDGPFDHLVGMPILTNYIRKNYDLDELVIVSPDAGRAKTAERYSSLLNCPMAIVHKQRSYSKHNSVEAKYLIGDVKGKICIVIDDMIDTAGTMCAAAEQLAQHGAKSVIGLSTHGIFSEPALERIKESAFDKIVVTNTLPMHFDASTTKIEVLSIVPLIADAITAVFNDASVSAIFEGKNQI